MITVVLPTRNPHAGRLQRTVSALASQTLPINQWEVVLVDNGGEPAVPLATLAGLGCPARTVRELNPGLTPARLAGIEAAKGEVIVFVDDDNLLAPDYLAAVAEHFDARPALGAAGGPVEPEWETTPPAWTREFHGLLALRDLGETVTLTAGRPDAPWPNHAPVGAGLAVRKSFAQIYAAAVAKDARRRRLDRRNGNLASGGDNDLVFTTLHAGGDVGYFPDLRLTHVIPAGRLESAYLARLNRGIMRSWVGVLALHGHCPWPAVRPSTVLLRCTRALIRVRAWRGPSERVRWAGLVGQFEGQADLHRAQGVAPRAR